MVIVNIYEFHGNHKSKTYKRYTENREKNTNITLKKIMKPQRKKLKEKEKNREELQKQSENK